jgi:hypothetical protein
MTEDSKPWSVAVFERLREPLVDFVKTEVLPLLDDTECRRIVIRAPVKSGKREMVEYIAMRDKQHGSARRVHAFLSAWHRVADDSQRKELEEHNLTNSVFSIINAAKTNKCIQWINDRIAQGKHVVLHLDECDHGSGERQMLSRVWRSTRDNVNITNILYSATPEEVLFSGEINNDYADDVAEIMEGHIVRYKPPTGYCGPQEFLDEGLIFNAKPFFTKVGATYRLTGQGKEIVRDLRAGIATNPERNIVVLRLSYNLGTGTRDERKENKAIYQFLENRDKFTDLEDFIVIADKGDKFGGATRVLKEDIKWSDDMYWESKATGRPILIVIDQTSSRSTEWRCHNRIFATHDYRDKVSFSVISQAQERVNHYKQRYGGRFQPIRVYGHRKSWELSAEKITYHDYLRDEWSKKRAILYQIRNTTTNALHPRFNTHVTRAAAIEILRRLGDGWKKHKVPAENIDVYYIKNTITGAIHPAHPDSMTEAAADDILHSLGCGFTTDLSQRVKGRCRTIPVIDCLPFIPCTKETFRTIPDLMGFRDNPFVRSDNIMGAHPDRYPRAGGQIGYLRSWAVFDYEEIKENKGWGFSLNNLAPRATICYKDGVLGVAVRKHTGVTRTVDTMTAFQSMYVARA